MNAHAYPFLLILILGFTTYQGLHRLDILSKYQFSAEWIRLRKQWYRVLSCAFLHSSWGHFFGNALSIYFFGSLLASKGAGVLLGIFFLSVAGGSLLCLFLHRDEEYRAIGASGGCLGLVFASVFIFPGGSIMLFPLPIPIPTWLYAIAYLFFTLQGLRNGSGNISHEGHLGGLLTGVLTAWLRYPAEVLEQPLLLAFVLAGSGFGIWYFHENPGRVPGFLRHRLRQSRSDHKRKRAQQAALQLDALLDKVSREGIHKLTPSERKFLEQASKERRNRR